MGCLYGDGEGLQRWDAVNMQDVFQQKVSQNDTDGNPDNFVLVTHPDFELSAADAFCRLRCHKIQVYSRSVWDKRVI